MLGFLQDDVTYSTLVHGKKGKTPPAKVRVVPLFKYHQTLIQ